MFYVNRAWRVSHGVPSSSIYQRWVPIPESRGDQAVVDFMSEMEQSVNTAQRDFEAEVRADAHSGAVLSKEAA